MITTRVRQGIGRLVLAGAAAFLTLAPASAAPQHGIAMYGDPALPPDFASLPYVNPEAPQGGRIVFGEAGSFDSLNPHILKGRAPYGIGSYVFESLMGRSWDEPFTLYGLLAESVETPEDRSWVEFTLRPEARFSDGTPVTVEDVLWSFETLGTDGHPRYQTAWSKVASAEAVGERTVRFTFSEEDRELPLILGLRPILKKAQWEDRDFTESGIDPVPIGTGPYVIGDFEPGRYIELNRDADWWGEDLPFNRGQHNIETIRYEFFSDANAMFEALKAGAIDSWRETNASDWETQYDFPAVQQGEVVKSVIPHERPSGITGLVMNTRRAPFDDVRVRDALMHAFNFEFINRTLTGGLAPRITSYFSNSVLGMEEGPASGRVAELLARYDDLPPEAVEGYSLPISDGTERNRAGIATALDLLAEAGWTVQGGVLRNAAGEPFEFEILLNQSPAVGQAASQATEIATIFAAALERLGIDATVTRIDSAQYQERTQQFDFDMTWYNRGLSLSPGNEQRLYWSSESAETPGSGNWMGVQSQAVDGLIDAMLTAEDRDDFVAATRALDRVLTAGRYVIPVWFRPESYLAHKAKLHFPESLPVYGDWIGFQPDVWWVEE